MLSSKLADALPMQTPQKTSGWKVKTSRVAASRLGQQKVSNLGDAIEILARNRRPEIDQSSSSSGF